MSTVADTAVWDGGRWGPHSFHPAVTISAGGAFDRTGSETL